MPASAVDSRPPAVTEAVGVSVTRDGAALLDGVDVSVHPGQHWVVMGRNGSGKSTLLRLLSLWLHPSRGIVRVAGHALGDFDIRPVRPRLPIVSESVSSLLRPALSAHDAVMAAAHGALETWWHDYCDSDSDRATDCLARFGVERLAARPIGTLSTGERQRVMLARALMTGPLAVFLDEPMAGLDLAGREEMHRALVALAATDVAVPTVLVTHHVEEIPVTATHFMALREGRTVASGPIESALTADILSETFGIAVRLSRGADARWTAAAR